MRSPFAFLLVASSLAVAFAIPAESSAAPLVPDLGGGVGAWSSPPSPDPLDPPFTANVQVSESDTPGNQNEITVAVASDGRIHMGWNDLRDPNPDYRCGYSYSTDGGLTWSANRLFILPGWEAAGDPVLLVDSNDDAYFICMSFNRTVWASRIVVYKSTDGGVTWSAGTFASDTTTGLNDKPWGYAIGTTLFVCYANFGAAPNELRVTRSFDGGLTWEPTQVVDFSGNGCGYAHTSSTNVIVGWLRGGAIYAYRSTNGGATWGAATLVGAAPFSPAGDQRAGALPSFAADPARGRLYAVWPANDGLGTWDGRSSRTTDGGATWSAP
ncbi:MAG: sialidase family protein, partial [Candidatus Thermoplasmatota archaeon]